MGEPRKNTQYWHKYYIPIKRGDSVKELQIVQRAFLSILDINKKRGKKLCRVHVQIGLLAKENRGGDHRCHLCTGKFNNVKTFIESLAPVDSHYCRNKNTNKMYLDSTLTSQCLCDAYNNSCADESLKVNYEFFRNIFCNEYNISFSMPVTDKYSKCIEYEEKRKTKDKAFLEIEFLIHKRKVNAFLQHLRTNVDKNISFSFDDQKNMMLPKVPDKAAYYSRQFCLYNFDIVQGTSKESQTHDKVFLYWYTWCEADHRKGSSAIASALHHILIHTDLRDYEVVRLFADGCGGQNKNTTMISTPMKWLECEALPNIREVQLFFPVTSHSFTPPDCVFGRIEKELRTMDTIVETEKYYQVFRNDGTVLKVGEDFEMYNWKVAAVGIVKKPNQRLFRFSTC
ncbi:hypothetical protein PR048_013198 [Dryococelus australis]|uniref:Uncharacterized protein n=1 Tax=Dryococelus australis TaxID=614101 RepID=A0ABQ9HRH6_9NEOP|nr:hypothetical protein PR048_013198 [Dryococelus australis]